MDKIQYFRGTYTDGDRFDTDLVRLVKSSKEDIFFNRDFLNPGHMPGLNETPFEGIIFAYPFELVPQKYIKDVLYQQPQTKLSFNVYVMALRNAAIKYFMKILKAGEKYIVFHSAGFDSRVISLCMMYIRDHVDSEIVKGVHFRCHQPENELFLEIMKRQGWPKHQYSVFEGTKDNYYNIGHKRLVLNGWQNYNQQMNFWGDLIPEGEEKQWNAMAGLGGELFKYIYRYDINNVRGKRCDNIYFNFLLDHYPNNGEWEGYWRKRFKELYLPFFGYDYLKVSLKVNPAFCRFDGKKDTVRSEIVKSFIRTDNVDCFNIDYGMHDYSWSLSEKHKKNMIEVFYNSKFYKDHKDNIPTKLDFFKSLYGHEAKLWGFMTVYDEVYK